MISMTFAPQGIMYKLPWQAGHTSQLRARFWLMWQTRLSTLGSPSKKLVAFLINLTVRWTLP